MSKGKTHFRGARCDIMRLNERNARRKARRKAAAYDRTRYDGHDKPEAMPA
jgi:hypothetical protein